MTTDSSNAERNSRNQAVIDELRANGGKISGPWTIPLLVLTTKGAKSGRPFTTPVGYIEDAGRLVIFASKAGAPENPDWYHNLIANPEVTVEAGGEKFLVRAEEVKGEERDRLYAAITALAPGFGDYEKRTTRKIPVITLTRIG